VSPTVPVVTSKVAHVRTSGNRRFRDFQIVILWDGA
jgi:hypothetical protein